MLILITIVAYFKSFWSSACCTHWPNSTHQI